MASDRLTPISTFPAPEASSDDIDERPHVVCGTDFSDAGQGAVDVAAEFARRLSAPLLVVHAVNEPARGSLPAGVRDSLALFERKRLYDEVERVKERGVSVVERVYADAPDEALSRAACAPRVRLLVLSAGRDKSDPVSLGTVADQVATRAPIPTLVVRTPEHLVAWLRGERALRVFIAADLMPGTEAAIQWALGLRDFGKCEITIAHIEEESVAPIGMEPFGSAAIESIHAQIRRTKSNLFRKYVRKMVRGEKARLRIISGWGPSDAHLIHLAREERADLIVTGTHHRRGFDRVFHHSVSRGLLHYAPMNVACVPACTATDSQNGHSQKKTSSRQAV